MKKGQWITFPEDMDECESNYLSKIDLLDEEAYYSLEEDGDNLAYFAGETHIVNEIFQHKGETYVAFETIEDDSNPYCARLKDLQEALRGPAPQYEVC